MLSWLVASFGIRIAQLCLLALWAAMAWQPLPVRLPRAFGLCAVFTLVAAWASGRDGDTIHVPMTILDDLGVFLVFFPAFTLIGWLFDWWIGLPEKVDPASKRMTAQFSLRQLLVWMGTTAGLLAWAKCLLPEETFPWGKLASDLPLMVMVVALCLPLVLATVGLVLADRQHLRFALWTVGLVILTASFSQGLILLFSGLTTWQEATIMNASVHVGFLGILLETLLILRLCGYRLVRHRRRRMSSEPAAEAVVPVNEAPAPVAARPWSMPFPYVVATILSVGILACWPAIKLEAIRQEARSWRLVGADPMIEQGQVTSIEFPQNQPVPEACLKKLQEHGPAMPFTSLNFSGRGLTDDQMHYLCGLTKLQHLDLSRTAITDAGLAQLDSLEMLRNLDLQNTRITGAGLAHLRKLTALNLIATQITDDGLAHLRQMEDLEVLWLNDTQITDAGLVHLRSLKKLHRLELPQAGVTQRGVRELRQAMPGCGIRSH
jgi:hypothetical protein